MGGASDPQATPTNEMMEEVLIKKAKEAGLVATETWLAKVKELLMIVQLTNRHGQWFTYLVMFLGVHHYSF